MRVVLKPAGLICVLAGLFVALVTPLLMLRRAAPRPAAWSSTANPRGAASLLRETDWKFYTEAGARAAFKPLSGKDVPSLPAYHFDIQRLGSQPWNVGFNNKLQAAEFSGGETLRVRFWGRSPGGSKVCLLLQKDAPPFPHSWKEYVTLEPEWKSYSLTFKPSAYRRGEALLAVFLGMDVGSVQLAGLRLERAD